jgi:GNAT superfamily N-acetyltransferase
MIATRAVGQRRGAPLGRFDRNLGVRRCRERLIPVLVVAELDSSEIELIDSYLPLNRLDQRGDEGMYLIAWEDDDPVGHARIAWSGTHLGLPEIQDVYVSPEHRRRGIATALACAAEREARTRGWDGISLSVSQEGNAAAKLMYAKLGYVAADTAPVRVTGSITLRGQPFAVDDTLVYLTKPL